LSAPYGTYLGDIVIGHDIEPHQAWSVRLSPSQAAFLQDVLNRTSNAQGLRNSAPLILLNEGEARRPGGRIILSSGDDRIEIPAVAPPERWLADPAPIVFLVTALWKFTAPGRPGGPPLISSVSGVFDVLAALAYKQAQPAPQDASRPVRAAFVSGTLYCLLCGILCWRQFTDNGLGEQAFPMVTGIMGITAASARYWDELDVYTRTIVCAGLVVLLIFMWLASPRPVDILSYFDTVCTGLLPLALGQDVGRRLSAEAEEIWALLAERSDELIKMAYRDGCEQECRLLTSLVDISEEALDELGEAMPPDAVIRIRQRFGEAREWLAQHRPWL